MNLVWIDGLMLNKLHVIWHQLRNDRMIMNSTLLN